MRKISSLLLVVISLLSFFSGCQQKEENNIALIDDRELSVFALQCSDELKEAIRNSYYDWFDKEHYSEVEREAWTDWEDTTDGVIQAYEPSHRYYGTFDQAVVWYWTEYPLMISAFQLAGSHFTYGSMDEFHVFARDKHYSLLEAYQCDVLSAEEVAIVAQRHRALREDYRNYGTYGKCQVWFADNKEGKPTELSLAGATFRHKEGAAFYVQKGGKQYTLQQAHTEGHLTNEDISQIATRHNEREIPALELSISDELKKAIETAYYQRQAEIHGANAETKTYDWDWADSSTEYLGSRRYYGTFDGCTVWCALGNADVVTDLVLAGSTFFYPQSAMFYVYRNGKHDTLQNAYNQGFLSAEDIAIASRRHKECEYAIWEDYSNFIPDDRHLSVFDLTLSDTMKMKAEYSYWEWYWPIFGENYNKQFLWADTAGAADENTVSCRYYGTFGKCFVWYSEEEPDLTAEFTIDSVVFQGASHENFHVYMDGEHYALKDAYQRKCLLSADDIALVAQRHTEYNSALYGHEIAGG